MQKHILNSTSEICKFLKKYNARAILVKLENGDVEGTLKAVEKMNQSNKKITNQDIMNLLNKKFEDIDRRFENIDIRFENIEKDIVDMKKDMNRRLDTIEKEISKINSKVDLMIQAPTMNREIDHDALAKINAN